MLRAYVPDAVYLVVGDSTAHRFDGLLLEHPRGRAVMKARWQPMSRVSDLFCDGKFSEYFTRILMEMRRVQRSTGAQWPFPYLPERIGGGGPSFHYQPRYEERLVLLFSYGECELFCLANDYMAGACAERDLAQTLSSLYEPLFDAVRTLKDIGFRHVFLHGITPPTRFEGPPLPPYEVRFKLATIGRELFERFAAEAGIGLVSLWDELYSQDKGRDPRFARDHLHLNQASAVLSAEKLCAELERRGFYDGMSGSSPEYPNTSMSSA